MGMGCWWWLIVLCDTLLFTENCNALFYRFRHGYGKHNPRKMVRTWAEKEMSNLFRMYNCGLPVPKPIVLRSHVLVMEFLGTDSVPAPRLKVGGERDLEDEVLSGRMTKD